MCEYRQNEKIDKFYKINIFSDVGGYDGSFYIPELYLLSNLKDLQLPGTVSTVYLVKISEGSFKDLLR